jgi:hypothetical protein
MIATRAWSELSERKRMLLLISAAVAEGILKLAALVDIKRRPASQIRGGRRDSGDAAAPSCSSRRPPAAGSTARRVRKLRYASELPVR